MRAFCTVSAPLEVCASSAEQLSPGSRFLALRWVFNYISRQFIWQKNNIRTLLDALFDEQMWKLEKLFLIIFSVLYRLLGQPQPKTLYFLVDAKSRVREVYTQTCLHFATQGMQDTELFGLAVLIGELQIVLG